MFFEILDVLNLFLIGFILSISGETINSCYGDYLCTLDDTTLPSTTIHKTVGKCCPNQIQPQLGTKTRLAEKCCFAASYNLKIDGSNANILRFGSCSEHSAQSCEDICNKYHNQYSAATQMYLRCSETDSLSNYNYVLADLTGNRYYPSGRTYTDCVNYIDICDTHPEKRISNSNPSDILFKRHLNVKVNLICKTGYSSVSGTFEVFCLSSREWSTQASGVCQQVAQFCANKPWEHVQYSYYSGTYFQYYLSQVNLQCQTGYITHVLYLSLVKIQKTGQIL